MRISNKLRSFLIIVISIVIVMASLPLQALRVNADSFTLTYNGNGGTRSDSSTTYVLGSDDQGKVTVLNNSVVGFSREGYVFKGWKNQAGDKSYSIGSEITLDANLDIYAQWAETCTITFDKNAPSGATVNNDMATQTVEKDVSTALTPNTYICTGYTFLGWNTDPNATTASITDKDNYSTDSNITLYAIWQKQFVVSFDKNGGNGSMDPQYVDQAVGSLDAPANGFTYSGYKFVDWRIGTDDSKHVSAGNSFTVDSDVTLYATWQQYWTITYDNNGGTGSISPVEVNDGSSTTAADPGTTITREGYSFWKWKDNYGNYYGVGDTITPVRNLILSAQWSRRVEVYANDGGNGSYVVYCPISASNVFNNTYTPPEGKTFLGWTTAQDSTVIILKDGDGLTFTGDDSTDVKVLYSQWGTSCTVSFDANDSGYYGDATGSMTDFTAGVGFTTTLPTLGYGLAGHTFAGWEVDSSVTGVTIDNTANTITIDAGFSEATITLKAKWTPGTHTVTFKNDDGSTIESKQYNYGEVPTLADPTKAPDTAYVYTFNGWENTSTNEVFKNGLPNVTGNVTYQATYTPSNRPYTVTASASPSEGITDTTISGSNRYSENAIITVTLADGYHVVKWTNNGTDVANTTNTYTFQVTGDHNVVVVLEKDPHTVDVHHSEGGGFDIEAPDNIVYGDTVKVTAKPEYGYEFINWTDKNGNEVTKDLTYSFIVTDDVELTANFQLREYTISVSDDGNGTASVSGTGTYKYFSECTITAKPNTGYEFVNWTLKNDPENIVSSSETYTYAFNGDYEIVANFQIKKYSISVGVSEDSKHGSVMGGGTYDHFASVKLTATPDEGYHFVKWINTTTGQEVIGESYSTYTYTCTGKCSWIAVFEINMYTVTYKNDDGKILQESEFAWGTNAYYQKATPTKAPTVQFTYTFAGWDNKVTKVTEDVTYTAVYDKTVNKYVVTFVNEDGKVLQTEEVEYGTMPSYNGETPVKAATVEYTYTFAGWDQELARVQGDITYTATYTAKKFEKGDIDYVYYKVVFNSNGGTEVTTQLVQEGYTATIPEDPMRERYNFAGWYIDEDLTKPFSFSTVITADITLYAKWVKGVQEVEITYAVVGDGTVKWQTGSPEGVEIVVERSQDNETASDHFKSLQIDGEDVAYFNYEITEGSVTATISAELLNNMDPGTYVVTIGFDDGQAQVDLIIEGDETPTDGVTEAPKEAANDPAADTGNAPASNYLGLWIALGVVALACLGAVPVLIIKRRGV